MIVSFVPMADIKENTAIFKPKEERIIKDVYKGFTYFKDNDVLLAKITPCFENGKSAIARNLTNGIGFGSTEFIVLRPNLEKVLPEWIYFNINSNEFIQQGKYCMTGTAGQQRISLDFVKQYPIIIPSLKEQQSIINIIGTEQELIRPSYKLIDVFTKKIQDRINSLFEEK